MMIVVHLLNNAQSAALQAFLTAAIEGQKWSRSVIATDDSDRDFIAFHGFTKADLEAAITALEEAIP